MLGIFINNVVEEIIFGKMHDVLVVVAKKLFLLPMNFVESVKRKKRSKMGMMDNYNGCNS